jgi:integrase
MMADLSLAKLIPRYIREMDGANSIPGLKPLGASHRYSLLRIARDKIAQPAVTTLKKGDVIDYAKRRRFDAENPVCPATVNQDLCYLAGVLKYAGSAWDECEEVTVAAIEAARPFLVKHQLIGKSEPRTRLPSGDELDQIIAWNVEKDKRSKVRMVEVILFALESARRQSEICRITHGDIDWNRVDKKGNPTPMYLVRDMKHPKKKKGNNHWFPITPNLAEIIRRQPRLAPDNPFERVFPFRAKTVSKRYTDCKKALEITNLRFHDNRAESITRWLKILPSSKVRFISGHRTTHQIDTVYDRSRPDALHEDFGTIDMNRIQAPAS